MSTGSRRVTLSSVCTIVSYFFFFFGAVTGSIKPRGDPACRSSVAQHMHGKRGGGRARQVSASSHPEQFWLGETDTPFEGRHKERNAESCRSGQYVAVAAASGHFEPLSCRLWLSETRTQIHIKIRFSRTIVERR